MTKREILEIYAMQLDRVADELWKTAHNMNLSDGHEAGIAVSCIKRDAKRVRQLAARPLMAGEVDFKEPVG